jgi:carbamoyl-phosphate synthase large subunit
MKKKLRVLLTAAAGPGGAGIINALKNHPLRDIDVVAGVVDNIEDSSLVLTQERVTIPYAHDQEFSPKILKICLENKIDLIVPAFSEECLTLSQTKAIFEEKNIKVLTPDYDNVRECHDKKLMNEILTQRYPEYIIPYKAVDQVKELAEACYQLGYPEKRVCVKPVVCNGGSRGFYIIDENYDRIHNYYFEKQPNTCSLDELLLKFRGETCIPELMVMKYIEGQEYGVDVVAQNGMVVASVIRRRLGPVLASMNMRVEIAKNEKIDVLIGKIVKELNLNSMVNFDLISNEHNDYVIEINPRQSAYIGTSAQKINLLAIAIDLLFGEEIDKQKYETNYENVMSVRYLEEFAICDGKIVQYKR